MKLLDRFFKVFKSKPQVKNDSAKGMLSEKDKDIKYFIIFYLNQSPYIKAEKRHVVLEHLLNTRNIIKTDNYLTLAEKKELGLNTRVKLTRELVDVLNKEGLALHDPKYAIVSIEHKARGDYSRHGAVEQLKSNNMRFKLICAKDERTCAWCNSMNEKTLPLDTDVNLLIQKNCTCEDWNRCVLTAEL